MKTIAVIAVMLVTSNAYATGGLIASWENQMDHFGTDTNFDDAYFVTDIGVTEGDYALVLDFASGDSQGYTHGLRTAYVDGLPPDWQPFFPQLEGAPTLCLDVTTNAAMFGNPGGVGTVWLGLYMQGQPYDGGDHFQTLYSLVPVLAACSSSPTPQLETIEWDLSYDCLGNPVELLPPVATGPGAWFEMRIVTCVSAEITNPGIMIFDNLRATPEPATLCLLALGGLAVIRRRK